MPAVLCLASVTALWLGTSPSALAGMIQLSQPTLSIPDQVQAQRGGTVTLPVTFNSGGHAIASTVFSVDYDQTWLTFDPTDSNGDGIPDDITFSTPPAFTPQVAFNPADTDGELDFVIADFAPPLASLPSGIIVSITFAVGTPPATLGAAVNFSQSPAASFGNTAGQSVPGTTDNGSVLIVVPTSTPTPTLTPTRTNTPTPTPTKTSAVPRVYLPLIRRGPPCVFTSTDVPKYIPDNYNVGVESTLALPAPGVSISNLTVIIDNLLHTYNSDLQIYLVAPDNRSVLIVDRVGDDQDSFIGTRLSDRYTKPIASGTQPFAGEFRPSNPLAAFNGGNSAGVWKLRVVDVANSDVGVLYGWSLEVCR